MKKFLTEGSLALLFVIMVLLMSTTVLVLGLLYFIGVSIERVFDHSKFRKLMLNYLFGVDLFGNTLVGGDPRETISSRLGRTIEKERYFWIKPLRNLVDFLAEVVGDGPDHCERSVTYTQSFTQEIWPWDV